VEEHLQSLDQVWSEVSTALKVAAEVMKRSRPRSNHEFKTDDLVWLEGTNVHTTHPKAKLAPRRHGPFKIISVWGVNCKLQLPKSWRIHPVFHNSLISPYKETTAHGPNFTRPPPEIVQGEDDHYEVEKVLQSKLMPNKRGILYLAKWKGYPDSENSWLPASGMKQAQALVKQFHQKNPSAPCSPSIKVLSVQHDLKEGILSRTYASVHDGPKGNVNLQGIASSSSCNGVNRPVWDGPPRTMHVKGLDNPTSVMKGPAGSWSLLKS
jgi:hypothetical protein